jgi:hypothetical protein
MKIAYHVTPRSNVDAILREGLKPAIGPYASEMGETKALVWCFPCLEDAYEMIPVWLEPFYGDDLAILELRIPEDFPVDYTGSDYELISAVTIPAEYISIYA